MLMNGSCMVYVLCCAINKNEIDSSRVTGFIVTGLETLPMF